MGKKISATKLRTQLGDLLDQLDDGETHFVVERNNREVAVLLSMEKFRDIMQMLELFNSLDYIDEVPAEFPVVDVLRPEKPAVPTGRENLAAIAEKLGIKIIK